MGKESVRILPTDEGWKRCSGGRVFHYLIGNQTLCGRKDVYVSRNYWDQIGNWPKCKKCLAAYNAAEKGELQIAQSNRARHSSDK